MNTDVSYLKDHLSKKDHSQVKEICARKYAELLQNERAKIFLEALNTTPSIKAKFKDYSRDAVIIGENKEIHSTEEIKIRKSLETFIPWRKGPFSVFGIEIDSEWRSNLKWNRISCLLDSPKDKLICDVGSGNGYYMYRMAHLQPELVLGLDPVHKFKLNFELLQTFASEDRLKFELMGYAELIHFKEMFDIILCMGILYHHKDPIGILQLCYNALKRGGQLIVESMGIPGEEPVSLSPPQRYSQMKNVWFIPTAACIESWLLKTNFKEINCSYNQTMQEEEQRRTKWSPVESFASFLNKDDPSKTKENFSRPNRMVFTARRG